MAAAERAAGPANSRAQTGLAPSTVQRATTPDRRVRPLRVGSSTSSFSQRPVSTLLSTCLPRVCLYFVSGCSLNIPTCFDFCFQRLVLILHHERRGARPAGSLFTPRPFLFSPESQPSPRAPGLTAEARRPQRFHCPSSGPLADMIPLGLPPSHRPGWYPAG